jgi:hypothetical protein
MVKRAAADPGVRRSREAQAAVTGGPLARGGTSRVPPGAADHAFPPAALVTPAGLSLPAWDALLL